MERARVELLYDSFAFGRLTYLYCPNNNTVGGASKSEGESGGEWKCPYRDDNSKGKIFLRYNRANPFKMNSLSKVDKSTGGDDDDEDVEAVNASQGRCASAVVASTGSS